MLAIYKKIQLIILKTIEISLNIQHLLEIEYISFPIQFFFQLLKYFQNCQNDLKRSIKKDIRKLLQEGFQTH